MNNQAFELITKQLDRLEDKCKNIDEKVDGLVRWKFYFTGVASVVGAIFGGLASIVLAWISRGK
jgi:hypothetical protein